MGFSEQTKIWFLKVFGLPKAYEIEKKYKDLLDKCFEKNAEKASYINTLESMLKEAEDRHVIDMKNINLKLDHITKAYEVQNLELKAITRELLWQKEEALAWRSRLETLMELNELGPGILTEIEKKRRNKKKKDEDSI